MDVNQFDSDLSIGRKSSCKSENSSTMDNLSPTPGKQDKLVFHFLDKALNLEERLQLEHELREKMTNAIAIMDNSLQAIIVIYCAQLLIALSRGCL